jgi:hypothetical protein
MPVNPGDVIQSNTINFIANFHGATLTNPTVPPPVGNVTILNNTIMGPLNWGTVSDNTDGYYSTSNPSRLTIPANLAGRYLVLIRVGYTPQNSTGARVNYLMKNGTIIDGLPFNAVSTAYYTYVTYFSIQNLAATDYLEVKVVQNSGASLDLQPSSYFQIAYLGA